MVFFDDFLIHHYCLGLLDRANLAVGALSDQWASRRELKRLMLALFCLFSLLLLLTAEVERFRDQEFVLNLVDRAAKPRHRVLVERRGQVEADQRAIIDNLFLNFFHG